MQERLSYTLLLLLLPMLFIVAPIQAQSVARDTSLVQYLERSLSGGTVQITQPEELSRRVARVASDLEENSVKVSVYRIQLFSSNNTNAKAQAEALSEEFADVFPTLPAMVSYVSPFWRLRIGEFRTYEEANAMLPIIQSKFPDMERGMLIIRERVSIQVHDYSND